jgi:hypothetical protein
LRVCKLSPPITLLSFFEQQNLGTLFGQLPSLEATSKDAENKVIKQGLGIRMCEFVI